VKLKLTSLLLLAAIGCPQPPTDRVGPDTPPPPVVATDSESEFVAALVRAVERGDFDDTDDFSLVATKAAKALGIKSVKKLATLDVTDCKPLKTEAERRTLTEKLR
jgi:hypothetical protein